MNESEFTRLLRRARREGFLDLRRWCDKEAQGKIEFTAPKATIKDLIQRHKGICETHEIPFIEISRTRAKSFVSISFETLSTFSMALPSENFAEEVNAKMRDYLLQHSELMGIYLRKAGLIAHMAWNPQWQCYLIELVDGDFVGFFSMTYRLKHRYARLFARAAVEFFSRTRRKKLRKSELKLVCSSDEA